MPEPGVLSHSQMFILAFRRGGRSQRSLGIQRWCGEGCCILATFTLLPLPVAEAYVGGMLFCLGIFLSFYLLTVLLACWENWR